MINVYFSDTEAVEACICRLNVMWCVWNIWGTAERICAKFTRKTLFGPLLRWVWRSRSISAACVRFMFGKTSLL